ncbi:MAG: sigma 54-interacting transcriptional regulator [Deltaproteobacteria bacterium]|nr:sigma 54-interacting transcriptional regulator [Deltaproteobacteria bacterium]
MSSARTEALAGNLRLNQLFQHEPTGGPLQFAGGRALIVDAYALGLLRKHLIATLGLDGARAHFTQFGFALGHRTATLAEPALPWRDQLEWQQAGGRLHQLLGMVSFEPVHPSRRHGEVRFADAIWRDSFEAEQHIHHHGRATDVACWTLTGFASGYLSNAFGREIRCFEDGCRGMGMALCTMVGFELNGIPERHKPALKYFESDCLAEGLAKGKKAPKRATEAALVEDELAKGIIGRSAALKAVVDKATRAASVDATVLILGESGTGKEALARLIHDRSPRAGAPMLSVNCAAVPEGLLESELFGHKRGAFTGALADRPGLFEAARGGTLFLDEIGELPVAMQAKLLRVLQEGEVRRVGENEPRPIDVRVVAATHTDLAKAMALGTFRSDLFYRLRVIELVVPALRERPEDVLPLARHFLAAAVARQKRMAMTLSTAAVRTLSAHLWPGNVRELANAIERAVALSTSSRLEPADLPLEPRSLGALDGPAARIGEGSLQDLERAHIEATLSLTGGHRAEAAERLGIGEATLYRKLREYGVTEGRPRKAPPKKKGKPAKVEKPEAKSKKKIKQEPPVEPEPPPPPPDPQLGLFSRD